MRIRCLAIYVCAAVAALLIPHTDAVGKARPDRDQPRAARTVAPDAANTETGIKLAQSMGGRRSAGRRAGRAFAPRLGGRRFGGRRAFGRRLGGRRYYTPIVPFVYGGLMAPYYYDYYDDVYPAGRCAYWHRRCVRNWGYRTSDYYGCMRYHGCSRY
jgi:hypothetical protein